MKTTLTNTMAIGAAAGLIGGGGVLVGQQVWDNYQSNNSPVRVKSVNSAKIPSGDTATTAYNKVANAVVSVLNFKQVSSNNFQESSEGSGVAYKRADGATFIVTNNHVISGASKLQVITHAGKTVNATVVGSDALTDLAVLKVNAADLTDTAAFGDSSKIAVGQKVLAIGSPLGSEYASTLTEGIISATKRLVSAANDNSQTGIGSTVIQTDAAINPGNSGGPLINFAGQVIGINSMKLSSSESGASVEGIGFAIPSDQVVDVVNKLVKDGKITRPALGIEMVNLSQIPGDEQTKTLKLPSSVSGGVVIMKVNDGSPASRAGLAHYDVIVGIDGKQVLSEADLRENLYKHSVGDSVKITYYHNGAKKTATVKLNQELKN
ncbi:trypsin-like peptidase domain-containing protein [Leuconostocaceae bacterium ESL0723]|nr:trypsin-like peptidase domain-containing protein [Leuconostocaceae bacterium ESL0723]